MPLIQATRLDILVLVDNVTDSLSSAPPFVTREWNRLQQKGMRLLAGGCLCCANHGLSLVITAHGPNGPRTMLFDGGPVDYAVERNGTRLGVEFGAIDAAMLSHGHWDHAGGIPRALVMIRAANGARDVPPMECVPTPEQWRALSAEPIVTDKPLTCLDDLFYISGEIPRVTAYENGLPNQVSRAADNAPWRPDTLMMNERFLAVHVQGKGLVVFSACSHAGVVNVLRHASDCFPGVKPHAAMGGFHLSGPTEAAIPETVRDLAGFDLDRVIPAHCTGWRAVNALTAAFGETVVVPAAVGKLFSL